MNVSWSEAAIVRMAETEAYIAQYDPAAAERLIELIFERTEALATFPQLGRVVPERPHDGLRELIIKGYRVVYRVTDHIEVVTVFEGHRRPPFEVGDG